MGLSSYKDEARAANEGAKVELKDRRMLSASHRFKKHDSEQLQKLMEEQERIFELVRGGIRHSSYTAPALYASYSSSFCNSMPTEYSKVVILLSPRLAPE